ncbi:MAG: GntR family transcriptional regulator [Propionibacteriaceae bacterium]|jgi:DNA-binding GntR family transcriptional regulator|nr:GntR family transcriptional regulator [Propionibacteriaceae bacterium]
MSTAQRGGSRQRAYKALLEQIVHLNLPPGHALRESELSATLDMSRTPIREALILLAEDGFVRIFPQIGSFVSRVDPQKVANAQFLRQAVEVASLADIVYPLNEETVGLLRENLDHQDQVAQAQDLTTFINLDEDFHHKLLDLAGHGTAWTALASAKSHLDRARMLTLRAHTNLVELASEHRGIFNAVVDGKIEKSKDLLTVHLSAIFAIISEIQDHSPELFVEDASAIPVRKNIVVWQTVS